MDWSSPVHHPGFAQGLPLWHRLTLILGHYDCRVYRTATGYIDVGAGSLSGMNRVAVLTSKPGLLGRVGRWCQFGQCTIHVGGEHANDQPVNVTFGRAYLMTAAADLLDFGLKEPAPLDIGNDVIVSTGAVVLDGASIGDGAVIGANAVLTRPAEPFGIYAGAPARLVRHRMTEAERAAASQARWWDFAVPYVARNITDLQRLAMTDAEHERIAERPRFVIRAVDNEPPAVLGVSDGDATVPAPARVQAYIDQALGSGPYYWLADCWAE